jgi:hypothetical protein
MPQDHAAESPALAFGSRPSTGITKLGIGWEAVVPEREPEVAPQHTVLLLC